MYIYKDDEVAKIYRSQRKSDDAERWTDCGYSKCYNNLNECVENLQKELNPSQQELMQKLLGAMQAFNDYNEIKRFGNGMKYMYNLDKTLKNDY